MRWRVSYSEVEGQYPYDISRHIVVVSTSSPEWIAQVFAAPPYTRAAPREALRRARLIAAAPELLEVCTKALSALRGSENTKLINELEAVIGKANRRD